MSLALLLEKYDVSTEEGLQKALCEIEKEEAEVDDALSGALSRACGLESRLRAARGAAAALGGVRADAQTASDMLCKTADLARDVSAKVRQLDVSRSRVAECQRRVHDLLDLQLCSAGVQAALRARDLDAGAAHVARYLSMDPRSLAAAERGAGRGGAAGEGHIRADMEAAAAALMEQLVRKFNEAARAEDAAAVERLFKLFPQIDRADEGVDLLANYLAKQAEVTIHRAASIPEAADGAVFADALTRVLEAGGALLERARGLGAAAGRPGLLPRALLPLQRKIDQGAARVYSAMCAARKLDTLGEEAGGGAGGEGGAASALSVEPTISELAMAHSRIQLYFNFVRKRTEADVSALPAGPRAAAGGAVERTLRGCALTRLAQELLAHYLRLERYCLQTGARAALREPCAGALDIVFYLARKCIRRSISTGSVDGACAVLNEAAGVLEQAAAPALRAGLRAAPPAPLPLAPPPPAARAPERPDPDLDAQRALFLAQLSEAEAGAEWAERLAGEAVRDAEPLHRSAADREKLQSCAAGLSGAAASLRAAFELGLAALRAALAPRALAWAETLVSAGADLAEDDAGLLPGALDALAAAARAALSGAAADALLAALLADVAARAEDCLLRTHYTQESGLAVWRRCSRLTAWAGGAGLTAARERLASLRACAALLALERASHAAPDAALAPARARSVLARRTDFKMEDIKRLKL